MCKTKRKLIINSSKAESLLLFRYELIKQLIYYKYKVVLVAPDFSDKLIKSFCRLGCEVEHVKLKRNNISIIGDFFYIFQLTKIIIRHRPIAVISYTMKPNIYGAIVANVLRTKSISIVTGLGVNFISEKKSVSKFIFKYLFKYCMSKNDLIILQNADDIEELRSRRMIKKTSNVVLVNGSGVDIDFYSPEEIPRQLNFLMMSRFVKSKGILEFLLAAKKMKELGYDASFTLVGEDDNSKDAVCRKLLHDRFSAYAEILEAVDDVRPLIKKASVYVLPSYREGTPRSVLEAMSAERPIITCDTPGCRQTVIHGDNGFLVEVGNVDSLVAAMCKFCDNTDLISRMGKRSRILVKTKFEVRMVTNQYIHNIKNVISGVNGGH